MSNAIDRTEFKGKMYKNIVQALETTFQNVYPGFEIEIQYRCERKESNCRYFNVYLKGETFNVKDEIPMLKPHLVYVDRYINSDAILFSDYSRADFEKINDYKAENMDIISVGIESITQEFKDQGKFSNIRVSNSGYRVDFEANLPEGIYLSRSSWYTTTNCSHNFSIVPISSKSAKAAVSKIRCAIKNCIERVEKECSKVSARD